jgi:hypothetical protein
MTAEEWDRKTGAPTGACAACGLKLAPGAGYVAALLARDGGFVREDRCEACADAAAASGEGALGVWRGKLGAPKGPLSRRLDFDTLIELFPRLDGRDDDASHRLRWVVALLLLRKKFLLQQSRETRDGVELLTVKFRHDDRLFRVPDPRMDDAALGKLHEELGKIFDLDPAAKAAK